jgi:hypothetical protein
LKHGLDDVQLEDQSTSLLQVQQPAEASCWRCSRKLQTLLSKGYRSLLLVLSCACIQTLIDEYMSDICRWMDVFLI